MKKVNNTFAILGLGRFGLTLAQELVQSGKEVFVMDNHAETVNSIAEHVTHSVVADITDENVLKSVGIRNFDVCIVAVASNMEASVLATLLCKELGAKKVVSRAFSAQHKKVLEKIGADVVVFPEETIAVRVASMLSDESLVDIADITPDFKISEIHAPSHWEGKTLIELGVRKNYSVNIMLIKRGDTVIDNLQADTVIHEDDLLVICGMAEKLHRLSHKELD